METIAPPLLFDLSGRRVAVCGHRGMAGSAIMRRLASEKCDIISTDRATVDLTRQEPTEAWVEKTKPDAAFLAAAHAAGVKKLLLLGSSCIYPKFAPQPITESSLLTGALEPTNEWYSIAKISGIKLALAYPPARSRM